MKKVKPEKSTIPISVSAKKSGPLKHQLLFTPYKIQWKNIQPTPASQTSSRTFFNTMKNDLSNLKNDVERMIKKQITRNDSKQPKVGVLEDSSNFKNDQDHKLYSDSSKFQSEKDHTPHTSNFDIKPISPLNTENAHASEQNSLKIDLEKCQKEVKQKQTQINNLLKQTRIQKNLITELKKENHELYAQIQQKATLQSQLQRALQLQRQNKSAQVEKFTATNESLKLRVIELEEQVQNQKQKNVEFQKKIQKLMKSHENEVEDLRSHNSFLEQKIEGLSQKMSIVSGKFKQKQMYIKELQTKLEALKISKREHQIQEEEEKKQITEVWKQKIQQKQKEFEFRLHEELKKSQKQFMQQIQYIEARTKQAVSGLEEENLQFSQKIKQLEQQIKLFESADNEFKGSQINQENKQLQKQSKQVQPDFALLGAEFERKINELVQQNYELKNKNTELESQIESHQIEKGSLLEQIKLYEQLQEYQKTNQSASSTELQKTIVQLHNLRREKDSMIEQFQFKIMKLENELQQEKNAKPQKAEEASGYAGANFNKILKDQLQENQDLKQKLREQSREHHNIQNFLKQMQQKLSMLNQELAIQKMKVCLLEKNCKQSGKKQENSNQMATNSLKRDLELLNKKYQALNSMLDSKNKQIKSRDEFIEKVLISKTGKKEEQEEIAYILKQIKSLTAETC